MALLDFFLSRKKNTANIAKERLQIIVAERRRSDAEPHYLPQLRKDIPILELNVTLPEAEELK